MLSRPFVSASFALGVVGWLAGCYSPDLGITPFRCAATGQPCPSGYLCDPRTKVCTREDRVVDAAPPDARILSDGEKPSKDGTFYLDGAVIKPSKGCADETSEPNNTAATATPLLGTGKITDWEVCYPGDVDHYAISLKKGQKLTVRVRFTHAKGDLDAALLDPGGNVVRTARGEKDDEEITTPPVPADGNYTLGVEGFGSATNRYDLEIGIE